MRENRPWWLDNGALSVLLWWMAVLTNFGIAFVQYDWREEWWRAAVWLMLLSISLKRETAESGKEAK